MADTFWDSEEVLGELEKNSRGEQIIVKKCTKKDKNYYDVRNYYRDKVGDLAPGKGIAIPEEFKNQIVEFLQK